MMNILHASTDPRLPERRKQMLGFSVRTDTAIGCLFVSVFNEVALEEVARGTQQAEAARPR